MEKQVNSKTEETKTTGYLYKIIADVKDFDSAYTFYGSSLAKKPENDLNSKKKDYKLFLSFREQTGKTKCVFHCYSFELFDKYGVEKSRVKILQTLEIESPEELKKLELELKQSNPCINNRPPLWKPYKEWYQDNKEAIGQRWKAYYEANKEAISQKKKQYYEANKERIQCPCGRELQRNCLSDHKKSKAHLEWFESQKEIEV